MTELRGEALVAQWQKMKDEGVDDKELSKWSIHLPPGYHKMLPKDLLAWLWKKKLDMNVEGTITYGDVLTLHCHRIRANKLGYSTITEYRKMSSPPVTLRYDIVENNYFEMCRNGKYVYERDETITVEMVELAKLCNEISRSMSLRVIYKNDFESFKFAMNAGIRYDRIAKYTVNVIDHLSSLDGNYLEGLEYYQSKVFNEWEKGIDAPLELEEGVLFLMQHSPNLKLIGENASLLWTYKNSPYWRDIMIQLNDQLALRAIERQRPTSRCVIQ